MTAEPSTGILDKAGRELLFGGAHTPTAFADAPVTDEQIRELYELVKWAPTSMNTQPLRLVLARSDDARARVVSHLFDTNKERAAAAPLVAVLAADTDFHETLPHVFPHYAFLKDVFAADEARRADLATSQAWLQAGYLILGVRALGLAVGPMGGFDSAGLDADLFAGSSLRSIVVLNIGHPVEGAHRDRNPRLAHEDVVTVL